jgi:glyoxylase-like metal-dependent hydrolase (beta-lactamase superfamily II)
VRELRTGLFHWSARHPQWEDGAPWGPDVHSYALDDGERLLLFDPIGPPGEIGALAAERDAAIILICPWHERGSRGLVERLDLPVYTPLPDTAQELMDAWGITAEQAGRGSPDVVWLLQEGIGTAHVYAPGDRLDVGIDVLPGQKRNDTVLRVEGQGVVAAGDTLVDFGSGLEINPRWLSPSVTFDQVAEGLRPLLDEPIEYVLATHGGPCDRPALERALTAA